MSNCGKDTGGHQPCYLPKNHKEPCLRCSCNMGRDGPSKIGRGLQHKVFCAYYLPDGKRQMFFQEIWDTTR